MLQLIVPGLFQPLRLWRSDFAFEPIAPSLLRLCAGARRVAVGAQAGKFSVSLSACDGRVWQCQPPAAWRFWQPRLASWAQLLESV